MFIVFGGLNLNRFVSTIIFRSNLKYYYSNKIERLTPPYMLVLMVSACLSKYFGSGPFFPKDGFEIDYCRTSWWTNLLYINNLVNTDKQVSLLFLINLCVRHSFFFIQLKYLKCLGKSFT